MRTFFVIFIIFICVGQIMAQGTIFDIDPSKNNHHGSFTFSHPQLDYNTGSTELSAYAGIYDLNLNIAVTDNALLHIGIPFNYLKIDDFDDSESGVGNIKIGLQTVGDTSDGNYSAGQYFIYLPSADEKSIFICVLTDIGEMQEYFTDIYAFTGQYAAVKNLNEKFSLNYYLGGTIIIPEKDSNLDNPEILFRCGFEPIINISKVNLFFTFKTIFLFTEKVNDFSDRFQKKIGFGGSYKFEKVIPKIAYQFYLDEPFDDLVNGILIFGLDFNLGE